MNQSKHRLLLVEDDAETRDELEEILRTLGCDVVSCGDKRTALEHVAAQGFCMAVLDLQIYGEPGAVKPREDHGRSLLREIRKVYPHYSAGAGFSFPILVVSGYAAEWEAAKEVTQEGASDIIRKPPKSGEVASSVRRHLQQVGRENHADCARVPGPATGLPSDLELTIPGTREGQRTEVRIGSRSTTLPDRLLAVLLHLIKGRLMGTPVHKVDMGDTGDRGFKLASDLNNEMKSAFPATIRKITRNHYHGLYSLVDSVTIGTIAVERLITVGEPISSLAREIGALLPKSGGNC